jgi:small-conductance mechanosensitive channel
MRASWIYLSVIVTATGFVLWLAIHKLRILQDLRAERLAQQVEPGPLPSFSDKKRFKKQQIKRMEYRFSIIRWTSIFAVLSIGAGVAFIPFAARLSPTFFPVVVATFSVVVGIAAKPFLENMICGLVLCFSKLARIGDTAVVDDVYGVIEDVTLTHCIIKRWDSLRYVVPNSTMLTKEFVNYSLNDNKRWVYVEFWIDYGADFKLVEELAIDSPKKSQYFSNVESPRFWVSDATQSAIKCMVVAWATSPSDGWMLSHDIRKALFQSLQEHKVYTHTHRISSADSEGPHS